jgi:hypothetical protein
VTDVGAGLLAVLLFAIGSFLGVRLLMNVAQTASDQARAARDGEVAALTAEVVHLREQVATLSDRRYRLDRAAAGLYEIEPRRSAPPADAAEEAPPERIMTYLRGWEDRRTRENQGAWVAELRRSGKTWEQVEESIRAAAPEAWAAAMAALEGTG